MQNIIINIATICIQNIYGIELNGLRFSGLDFASQVFYMSHVECCDFFRLKCCP